MAKYPDADLAVYAIWLPMLGGDDRGAIDAGIFDDTRALDFWDEQRVSGAWFGEHDTAGLGYGGVLWDAYLLFDREARWEDEPTGLVAAGTTIIGNTDALEERLPPLLERG